MSAEDFIDWMMLEAWASRQGLPVHPIVEDLALKVDGWMRNCAQRMSEVLAKVKPDEQKRHFWRNVA